MVGPVGFEPTTSGPKTLISQGRQRPRLTARILVRSGILLAEIVFPDQAAQRALLKSLLDDGPANRNTITRS